MVSATLIRRLLAFALVIGGIVALQGVHHGAEARERLVKACYPANQFSTGSGPAFDARSFGSAYFEEAEIQLPSQDALDTANGERVSWYARGTMSNASGAYPSAQPGTIGGMLNATIEWRGSQPRTRFTATCMAEVQTSSGYDSEESQNIREIELEAEGTVTGFPSCKKLACGPATTGDSIAAGAAGVARVAQTSKGQDAVASIVVKIDEAGKIVKVSLGIELGTTCNEQGTDGGTEVGLSTSAENNRDSIAPFTTAGAFGLPDGFTPGTCPPGAD